MKSQIIRVDGDVFKKLQDKAIELKEPMCSPNYVLRVVFGLPVGEFTGSQKRRRIRRVE